MNKRPIEAVLKELFESPYAGDDQKRAVGCIYEYIKKLRRKIDNQARELTTLRKKLERINES